MSSDAKAVPTFADLKKKLSSELKIVRKRQRNRLVREIIKLAKRKLEMEEYDRQDEARVPEVRASMAKLKKILTPIFNAIEDIKTAKRRADAEHLRILKGYGVIEALDLLESAAQDIAYEKDHMYPGSIPRKLRNRKDRETRFPLQLWTKVNHTHVFIRELDTRLDKFVGPDLEKLKVGRDRLIKKVLHVLFDENLAEKTIERIRNKKA